MSRIQNILSNAEKKPLQGFGLLWAAALVLLVLCSFNTSPLNPFYGGDSTIYTTLGRATAQGALPYADIYDHKGPLVFYLHALGCLTNLGKTGMLLLQSMALATSMLLTYRICRLWASVGKSLAGLGLFAAVYAVCLWGGDMTEEYSLPLSLLPAYLILRELVHGKVLAELPVSGALAAGLGIGLSAFLRLNNAAPLCGVLIGLVGCVQNKRDMICLLRYAGVVLLGVILATLPFLLYFAAKGALHAMMMGTFVHNYHYAVGHTVQRDPLGTAAILLKLAALPLFLFFLWRGNGMARAPRGATTALAGFVVLSLLEPACGPESSHYFITAAPATGFTLAFCPTRRQLTALLIAGALLLPFAPDAAHLLAGFRRYNIIRNYQEDINAARRLAAQIPPEERDSVWSCDVHAGIYVYGNLLPCFRYFTLQSSHAQHNPEIVPAISQMLRENPPRWIIVPTPSPPPASAISAQTAVRRALDSGTYALHYTDKQLGLELWRHLEP